MKIDEWGGCPICFGYLAKRREVLRPHVRRVAKAKAMSPAILFWQFMVKVHERHQSGLSLKTGESW